MKVNLQKENFLSKDERKKALGGDGMCYVRCQGESSSIAIETCNFPEIQAWVCNTPPVCCTCQDSNC